MYEIRLINAQDKILGMGYSDTPDSAEISNLREQMCRSGIEAELVITPTTEVNMDALGDHMAEYQQAVNKVEREVAKNEWGW